MSLKMRSVTLCHSRVSGNPEPRHVRPSLDARFRGHDTDVSESSPHFGTTHTTTANPSDNYEFARMVVRFQRSGYSPSLRVLQNQETRTARLPLENQGLSSR